MEYGFSLPTFGDEVPAQVTQAAVWAHDLGFDSVWANDHVVMPRDVDSPYPYAPEQRWNMGETTPWFDPLLVLAWAGAAAPQILLGTSVIVLPLRHPVLLAKQLASLDALTNGRVVLGTGVGWLREESAALGIEFADRWSRTDEMVALMRRLWSGERVDYRGQHFMADGLIARPTPVRPPPILWGGRSRAALRRVAKFGDGWYPLKLSREEFVAGLRNLHELCEEFDRDPASLTIYVGVGPSEQLTADVAAWYDERGVDCLVCLPPRDDMSQYRSELERIASECGLTKRSPAPVLAAGPHGETAKAGA